MEPEVGQMYSFDISILDKDGNEIQPNTKKGSVNVEFNGVKVSDGKKSSVEVYHMGDSLKESDNLDADITTKSKKANISVETNHFSVYTVVVTDGLTAGSYLYDNKIYRIEKDTTLTASSGRSGLVVYSNANTVLWIKKGVTLTVKGGDGSQGNGGGAGIYLPANATLTITGDGTLNATGGNGGAPGNGGASGASKITWKANKRMLAITK